MSLYVYLTEECKEDAKKHNVLDDVQKLKEKVERVQTISHFDNFPSPYLKKRFRRQQRLLADPRTVVMGDEEHVVVCFLRVFIRSNNEYISFLANPTAYGEKKLKPLVGEEELLRYLKERLTQNPVPEKDVPTESEDHFLYRLLGDDMAKTSEGFVCESEEWVRNINQEELTPRLISIFEGLVELMVDSDGFEKKIRQYSVLYRWYPHLKKLFLAGITSDEEEKSEIFERYQDILTGQKQEMTEDKLLRSSLRTYPAIILADENGWMAIQKDEEANLALSPEETEVLESVHCGAGFPIFINGRAGSGKSTILYHLFADYVNLYLDQKKNDDTLGVPLLISSGRELKERAHKSVASLVKCNPRWAMDKTDTIIVPSECFREFHDFLFSMVPEDVREDRFPVSGYVDFAKFRNMWWDQFQKEKRVTRKTGPDLSWHIIRSYIKGTNPDGFLEPDDYTELPRRQKSVTQDSYELVYSRVWDSWYRPMCGQGYWDDQDLARYVFENSLVKSEAPAVFCDESQDFTRVELDVIFRLCLFVDRKLSPEALSRVPFAFAGDPFQTLNPTGFRWDAIQASFHDKLMDTIGGNNERRDADVKMNYKELNLNYRSTRNIVRFCNLIQALRAALFKLPTLQPQRTWQTEKDSPFPVWFDRGNIQTWEQLKEEKDITIIVPCSQNEEKEFVSKHSDLQSVVQRDDSGVPLNVLSPARAKGLEFGRVVLFGFADCAPTSILGLLDSKPEDEDALLPLEYFVNQLYVAASRPKRRLFIIDSSSGRETLWRIANDEIEQRKIWALIPRGESVWSDDVGGFQNGNEESWQGERGNPEENAKNLKQQGLTTQDSFMLRAASQYFDSINERTESRLCKAYALSFESKKVEAGHYFVEAGKYEKALKCYWDEGLKASSHILELGDKIPEIHAKQEYKLMYEKENGSVRGILDRLEGLLEICRNNPDFRNRVTSEPTFHSIIELLFSKLLEEDLPKNEAISIVKVLNGFSELGLKFSSKMLAEFLYLAGDMSGAVSAWETCVAYMENPRYRKARAYLLASEPDKIKFSSLSEKDARILADYFLERSDFMRSILSLGRLSDTEEIVGMISKVPSDYSEWQRLLIQFCKTLSDQMEWQLLIDLATGKVGRKGDARLRPVADKLRSKKNEFRNALIISCSRSEQFPSLNAGVLKNYSDYLAQNVSVPSQWKSTLTLQVVGAAIERAGRWKDVLPFYESVISDSTFSKDDVNFAKQRWLRSKSKQIKREQDRGNRALANKHINELQQKRKEYDFDEGKLPEFPKVSKVWVAETKESGVAAKKTGAKSTMAKAKVDTKSASISHSQNRKTNQSSSEGKEGPDIAILGKLKFEFFEDRGRLNITHVETAEILVLRKERQKLESFDVEISEKDGIYTIDDWALECDLTDIKEAGISRFRFLGKATFLEFKFSEE